MGHARSSATTPRAQAGSARRRVRTGDLKDRAYRQLKELILCGEFAGGEFLSERQLSTRLGMSKTPVRVALERLELEGFVRVSPQLGVLVRELSVEEIADQFQIRLALEGFAMRAMAGRLSSEQVRRVEQNLAEQSIAADAGDVARAVELDTEFHMLFCKFLGNHEISRVMGQLRDRVSVVIRRVFHECEVERFASNVREHRGIARAVIAGNAPLAVKRLERHLEFGKRSLVAPRRS